MTPTSNSAVDGDESRFSRILQDGATRAVLELFAAYGVRLGQAGGTAEKDAALGGAAFLTISGFSGPHFSGFIALATTEHMLRRSNSTTSSSDDWMAELGNQLLGRVKNLLLKEGISIFRVPPAVVKGGVPCLPSAQMGETPVALGDNIDSVFIWTKSEPSLEASFIAFQPQTDVMTEGDLVLF